MPSAVGRPRRAIRDRSRSLYSSGVRGRSRPDFSRWIRGDRQGTHDRDNGHGSYALPLAWMMAMPSMPFKPDYAPPPGRALNTHLESFEMSVAEFAKRCGRPVDSIQELVSGKAPLDRETASLIAKELGGAAETWLGIEREYRQKRARDAENISWRKAIWERIPFLPRILSRACRALGHSRRRSLARQETGKSRACRALGHSRRPTTSATSPVSSRACRALGHSRRSRGRRGKGPRSLACRALGLSRRDLPRRS